MAKLFFIGILQGVFKGVVNERLYIATQGKMINSIIMIIFITVNNN